MAITIYVIIMIIMISARIIILSENDNYKTIISLQKIFGFLSPNYREMKLDFVFWDQANREHCKCSPFPQPKNQNTPSQRSWG